jgi:hypothetical protein
MITFMGFYRHVVVKCLRRMYYLHLIKVLVLVQMDSKLLWSEKCVHHITLFEDEDVLPLTAMKGGEGIGLS